MFLNKRKALNDENKFYELAKKLDKIILKFNNNIFIVSNHSLHMTRNHPEYLNYWKPVIHPGLKSKLDLVNISNSILKSLIFTSIQVLAEFLKKKPLKVARYSELDGIDLMIVSHFVGNDIGKVDLYYGDFISQLVDSKKSIVRVLIPQSETKFFDNSKNLFKSHVLNNSLSKSYLMKYVILNLYAIFKLIFYGLKIKLSSYEILVIVIGQINNFSNIKISFNLKQSIEQLKPKQLVTTFEGNAIERSIFLLCHESGVESFGFQHAPIIKSQYSIFRSLRKELDPDTILASGPYVKNIFESKLGTSKKIEVIGSPKNISLKKDWSSILNNKLSKILLVPDGNISSISNFLNLGIYLSKNLSNYQLRIRAHPLFEVHLEEKILNSKDIINFKYSKKPLEADLIECKWIIYENSSVAVQAGFYGCQLIYYDNPLSNIDPLYELKVNKFTATSAEQVYQIISKNLIVDFESVRKAQEFCSDYFSPHNLDVIL